MTSQMYPTVGLKGFGSKTDVEAYLAAFSADDYDTYFQYYHPDIHVSAHMPSTADEITVIRLGIPTASPSFSTY